MSSNTNMNPKSSITSSQYKIIIVVFVASLLFYAVYISYNYHVERFVNDSSNKSIPMVALFFASWCGYCTKYQQSGVFDNVNDLASKDPSMNGRIKFIKYDYDTNKKLANAMGIDAFPSIVLIDEKGSFSKSFKGDIYNPSALLDFANDAIAS